MTPNRFNSELDELFAPYSDSDSFWIWADVAYWALVLALLAAMGSLVPDILEWVFA